MQMKLSLSTLDKLPETVARPSYHRKDLSPGILHIGVGNFHRAHQAVYLDKLFNTGRDLDWAIIGAGVKSFDADRRLLMQDQDWLTTVVELDPHGLSAGINGAMIDFLDVDGETLINKLADPAIRIVSLTITEGGYFVDAAGGFDADHQEIVRDAANPGAPQTVFGLLLAGLQLRHSLGHAPFTILSCDNLPENGQVTRQSIEGLANLISPDLRDWVSENVAFPNSMVDCITPGTSQREIDMVRDTFGIEDASPVVCEPFRQWVMEDNFPLGRPALEQVGVEFVDNVVPYETMKLRILNAGHAAIAYPAALLGHQYVHDAMADPDIASWLVQLMRREVIPVLQPIAGVDFDAYLETCVSRFANPAIGDTIARLCQDGSNRQPKFVFPTITDALAKDTDIEGLTLEVALWCLYCAQPGFVVEDARADRLSTAALASKSDPAAFLSIRDVFGDLAANDRFANAFTRQMGELWTQGPRHVIQRYLRKANE
ncbi:mannitol dehydrogenase family protein [Parasedimentitalea marina]|uniref:Mannitol dehydrogenase family protein n=1 Tax=Parasedimentitalea marina TaxID=2483033 RepID=A0A3T0N8T2_9RHOB|nr:mannitol dehydrogenase family protein [Parasedimentitalea marina]AZV80365.1 mannitol dehydrogenase family protein [Parasedimentitalea marina]